MKRYVGKALDLANTVRMAALVWRGNPVSFKFRGRRYWVNPDGSAIYHVKHSTEKIANMTDLIPTGARVIVDVGANCGLFSAFSALRCPDAAIHCFEPAPRLLSIIERNVPPDRVKLHPVAVGDSDGNKDFFMNRRSEQTNSFNRSAVELFAAPGDVEVATVKCVTLDGFAATNGIAKIDVLKVDVQGFEGAVFRGARSILSTVDMLFVESTWMDIDSIVEIVPFALNQGFTHAAVLNPVYMGADVVLSRSSIQSPAAKMTFDISSELLDGRWR